MGLIHEPSGTPWGSIRPARGKGVQTMTLEEFPTDDYPAPTERRPGSRRQRIIATIPLSKGIIWAAILGLAAAIMFGVAVAQYGSSSNAPPAESQRAIIHFVAVVAGGVLLGLASMAVYAVSLVLSRHATDMERIASWHASRGRNEEEILDGQTAITLHFTRLMDEDRREGEDRHNDLLTMMSILAGEMSKVRPEVRRECRATRQALKAGRRGRRALDGHAREGHSGNVVPLPSPETLQAVRRIARHVLGDGTRERPDGA